MSLKYRPRFILPLLLLVAFIAPSATALAHERRTIAAGKYDVVVGWDVEPAYQSQKNAASIRISQSGTSPTVPVTGVEKTLKVQIRQGNDVREFPLRTVFGQSGYYVADLVPTPDSMTSILHSALARTCRWVAWVRSRTPTL